MTSTKCQYNKEQLTKYIMFLRKLSINKKHNPTKTWKPWNPVPKKKIEQKEKSDMV